MLFHLFMILQCCDISYNEVLCSIKDWRVLVCLLHSIMKFRAIEWENNVSEIRVILCILVPKYKVQQLSSKYLDLRVPSTSICKYHVLGSPGTKFLDLRVPPSTWISEYQVLRSSEYHVLGSPSTISTWMSEYQVLGSLTIKYLDLQVPSTCISEYQILGSLR